MDALILTIGLIISVFAIAMASSIVWHTEHQLDLTFKFFLVAIVLMMLSLALDLGYIDGIVQEQGVRRLFSNGAVLFMLLGFVEMRQLMKQKAKKSSSKKRR